MSTKLKTGQKEKIEFAISDAMVRLEVGDASSDDLTRKEFAPNVWSSRSCKLLMKAKSLSTFTLRSTKFLGVAGS